LASTFVIDGATMESPCKEINLATADVHDSPFAARSIIRCA